MKLKRVMLVILSLIVIILLVNILKKDIWDKNADLLKEKVLSIDETRVNVNLSEITPFDWDTVYTFSSYTSTQNIYNTVGYKWDTISETVNEGMNQIVFMKDGKVVCYIYGYPVNNGYGISFRDDEYKNGAIKLNNNKNLDFKVERNDDVIFLIQS
ncbi:MAG: lipoprotein [Anaerocolumna sp.]|jgi:uncharacterized protein YxeA|nr:lipoprotein [Anaerocolumna sp.]